MDNYSELVRAAYAEWDNIIVTAMDDEQKGAYEQLIEDHIMRWRKRSSDIENKFILISDPIGRKVGNGGSTIYALQKLHERYGDALFEKKMLLIHAGGYSQRMPNSSALGKLFIVFPSENDEIRSMLEVKLLLSAAFAREAPGGVLLMSADDIEVYDFGINVPRTFFSESGFTAVAHPTNDIDVASKHGVYVIEPATLRTSDECGALATADCVRVLQKPTEARMRDAGAFLQLAAGEEENLFIDSFFFFAHPVSRILLQLAEDEALRGDENALLTCEVDAYGDFLQALGAKASRDYVQRGSTGERHVRIRNTLFDALHNCQLKLLVVRDSAFFHVGTNSEYLEHMCTPDLRFYRSLRLASRSQSLVSARIPDAPHASVCCCVLQCNDESGGSSSELGQHSILEFCSISAPSVRVGSRCILSNVEWHSNAHLHIPSGSFAQTIALRSDPDVPGATRYVTLFCSVDDDLKATANSDESAQNSIMFCGAPLAHFLTKTGLNLQDVFGQARTSRFELWRARLFPVASRATDAFRLALRLLNAMHDTSSVIEDSIALEYGQAQRVSLFEAFGRKDVGAIIAYRSRLLDDIRNNTQHIKADNAVD